MGRYMIFQNKYVRTDKIVHFYLSHTLFSSADWPIDTQGQSTSNVAEILPFDRFGVVGVKYAESDTTKSQIFFKFVCTLLVCQGLD